MTEDGYFTSFLQACMAALTSRVPSAFSGHVRFACYDMLGGYSLLKTTTKDRIGLAPISQ